MGDNSMGGMGDNTDGDNSDHDNIDGSIQGGGHDSNDDDSIDGSGLSHRSQLEQLSFPTVAELSAVQRLAFRRRQTPRPSAGLRKVLKSIFSFCPPIEG